MIDDAKNTLSRTTSVGVCKDVWGPNYATGGKECDEYPFAATREGSFTGRDLNGNGQLGDPGDSTLQRFSVRPILGTDNGTAGSRLNAFYTAQRVIDADAFYVGITP
jgi:hypothetical protein